MPPNNLGFCSYYYVVTLNSYLFTVCPPISIFRLPPWIWGRLRQSWHYSTLSLKRLIENTEKQTEWLRLGLYFTKWSYLPDSTSLSLRAWSSAKLPSIIWRLSGEHISILARAQALTVGGREAQSPLTTRQGAFPDFPPIKPPDLKEPSNNCYVNIKLWLL